MPARRPDGHAPAPSLAARRRGDVAIETWEEPQRPRRRWPLLIVAAAVVVGGFGARALGAGAAGGDQGPVGGELSIDAPETPRPASASSEATRPATDLPAGGEGAETLPEGADPRIRLPEGAPPRLEAMAPGPLAAREYAVGAWTGTELVIAGGARREGAAEEVVIGYVDAAAYDPATRRWRQLATAPGHRVDGRAVWTGSEIIVVGGNDVDAGPAAAPATLALDPAGAGSWSDLPPLPVGGAVENVVWTGREVVASIVGDGPDDTSMLYALDPAAPEPLWRPLPAPVTAARPAALFYTDRPTVAGPSTEGALVTVDFDFDTGRYRLAAFDLARAAWAVLPSPDEEPGWEARFQLATDELLAVGRRAAGERESRSAWRTPLTEQHSWDRAAAPRGEIDPSRLTTGAWTGRRWLLAGGRALGGAYDPEMDAWATLPPLDRTERFGAVSAWTGDALLVWGGTDNERAFADGLAVIPGS